MEELLKSNQNRLNQIDKSMSSNPNNLPYKGSMDFNIENDISKVLSHVEGLETNLKHIDNRLSALEQRSASQHGSQSQSLEDLNQRLLESQSASQSASQNVNGISFGRSSLEDLNEQLAKSVQNQLMIKPSSVNHTTEQYPETKEENNDRKFKPLIAAEDVDQGGAQVMHQLKQIRQELLNNPSSETMTETQQ